MAPRTSVSLEDGMKILKVRWEAQEKPASPAPAAVKPSAPPKINPRRRSPKTGPTNVPTKPGRLAPDLTPKPKPPVKPPDREGETALRKVLDTVRSAAFIGQRVLPTSISPDQKQRLEVCLTAGATILRERPEPDQGGLFIGVDFGTSASKVVIRQQGAGAYALPVPPALRAIENGVGIEHLWPSVVWLDGGHQTLSLFPQPGAAPLGGFKAGLIEGLGHRMVGGVTHAQAAAAYVTMLVAYILGYHRLFAPDGFDRSAHYSRFHFGVPVACKHEGACAQEFERVFAASFDLAPRAARLDLPMVADALHDIAVERPVAAQKPFLVYEELAGVIAGYRATAYHAAGPHVIVDVGAATLDVATFRLGDDEDKVPVFMSAVELLGAEPLAASQKAGIPDSTFRAACHQHTRRVISITAMQKNPAFGFGNNIAKPLLLVGGGSRTLVHSELYAGYPKSLQAPMRTPSPRPGLEYDAATDPDRLLLAWGLAQDEPDLPELKPPSQIEDYVRRHVDLDDRFVTKDMC